MAKQQKIPYYWTSEGVAEVDLLIESDHEIYPIEIKAGINLKKKSLLVYQKKYHPSKLLRTTALNLKHDGDFFNYPLYFVSAINNNQTCSLS